MDLDFTKHAVLALAERNITREMLEHVLTVGRRLPSPSGNTIYEGLLQDGRPMRVVIAEEYDPPPLVVTVFMIPE